MADRQAAALAGAATGAAARALAARLAQHGYQVSFPPGRDPAVFKVTGLPGSPYVEVNRRGQRPGRLPLHRPHHGRGRRGHRPAPGSRPAPGRVRAGHGDRDLGRHRDRVALPAPGRAACRPGPGGRCPARPPGRPRRPCTTGRTTRRDNHLPCRPHRAGRAAAPGRRRPGRMPALTSARPATGRLPPGHRLAGGAVHPGGRRGRQRRVGVLALVPGRRRPRPDRGPGHRPADRPQPGRSRAWARVTSGRTSRSRASSAWS